MENFFRVHHNVCQIRRVYGESNTSTEDPHGEVRAISSVFAHVSFYAPLVNRYRTGGW